MIEQDLTRVICDRCTHVKVIEATANFPPDWKRFSGPTGLLTDLCPNCIKSFSVWMSLLKPR